MNMGDCVGVERDKIISSNINWQPGTANTQIISVRVRFSIGIS